MPSTIYAQVIGYSRLNLQNKLKVTKCVIYLF